MKFKHNPTLDNYIDSLIETNYLNMSLSDMFSEIIGNRSITNKKEIETLKAKFKQSDINLLGNKYFEYWELDDENEEDNDIFNNIIIPSIKECDLNKYLDNPYYKRIKLDKICDGDYTLEMDHYEPYELFPYKDMGYEKDSFLELNSFSFFTERFDFLSINHKKVTWMSVTPNEIETMEKAVSDAKGKVIVYGLGLGYYPYMISLKDDVKDITIIENDKNVINLFNKYILPLFEHKEKIKVIECDAFDYMSNHDDFDYAFIDLWHDPYDGIELFLRSKKLEKPHKQYFYWLESSFYILLRRCFISFIEEQLANVESDNYHKSSSVTDDIINTFYSKTKNLVIESVSQLQDLLSDSSLLNLLIK